MIKIPLILAHGQEIIAFISYVGAAAIIVSAVGVVFALRKKKDSVSRLGLACALFGILFGALLAWWHGISTPFLDWLSVIMLAPLPMGIAALILSLKRKRKNA